MPVKRGVLGGTFDPVHQGHLALARAALDGAGLDEVLFVPAGIPPHKITRADMTSCDHRYRMVEIAVQDEPRFIVSDVEKKRPGISYTVDTLRELHARYPQDELHLVLGVDTLREIPTWQEPEEICRLAKFLVAAREGVEFKSPFPEGVERLNMSLQPVSSTEVRERLMKRESTEGRIPPGVVTYIEQNGLYRKGESL